jgi:predicted metallo-beta-lactamase superfamily hydrolase
VKNVNIYRKPQYNLAQQELLIDNHIVRATRYNGKWSKLVNKTHNIEVFEE